MNESKNDSNQWGQQSVENSSKRQSRTLFYGVITVIIFVSGLGVGFTLGTTEAASDPISVDEARALLTSDKTISDSEAPENIDFALFWSVWDEIKSKHVEQKVTDADLFYGALTGIVNSVEDPYSVFLPPTDTQEFVNELQGSFEGIGAEIGVKDEQLTVIAPLPDSPAERAGLLPGDRILAVDTLPTATMSIIEAVQHIRGEKGTTVTLLIGRDGEDGAEAEPFDIVVTRDTIQVDTVRYRMLDMSEETQNRIGYIQITQFNIDTTKEFEAAVNELLLEQPDGVVLDLRNNPGGFLDASVSIASKFIEEGSVIVYEESVSEGESPYLSFGKSPLREMQTVVLINAGSASASEIVAGALKDYEKATIIGTTSFGKGTVQDFQTFDDGSSLKLTVARWLTPNKHLINGIGIYPDYFVDQTIEDFSQDIDPPLEAAVQWFNDSEAFAVTHELFVPPIEEPSTDVAPKDPTAPDTEDAESPSEEDK